MYLYHFVVDGVKNWVVFAKCKILLCTSESFLLLCMSDCFLI